MAEYWIKAGDTGPSIKARPLRDGDGNAVNIQGATLRFIMTPVSGGAAQVAAAAVNEQVAGGDDGTRGWARYDWVTADTGTPGDFYGEFEVTFVGGQIQTFPDDWHILIHIVGDLD